MIKRLQYLDLINKSLQILDTFFLNGFNSKLLFGFPILGEINNAESPRAKFITEVIFLLDFAFA